MSAESIHKLAALVLLVGLLPLWLEAAGVIGARWVRYTLPALVIAIGAFLVLDPIVFHGGSFGAEGLQHQIQGAVALALGAIEIARARGRLQGRGWALLLPLGIAAVGMIFMPHAQHATMSMRAQLGEHRMMGVTIIAMAIVLGAERVLSSAKGNWPRIGWLIVGGIIVAQLMVYAEDAPMTDGAQPAAAHGGH